MKNATPAKNQLTISRLLIATAHFALSMALYRHYVTVRNEDWRIFSILLAGSMALSGMGHLIAGWIGSLAGFILFYLAIPALLGLSIFTIFVGIARILFSNKKGDDA